MCVQDFDNNGIDTEAIKNTLLHEMIHADYICQHGTSEHGVESLGHGPIFMQEAANLNALPESILQQEQDALQQASLVRPDSFISPLGRQQHTCHITFTMIHQKIASFQ